MKIAIIGGGASGLFCANKLVELFQNQDISIDIIEKDKRVGKKLLMTGNGKGNISNLNVNPSKYNSTFVTNSLNRLSCNDLYKFFEDKGVLLINDEEGRVYPRSGTANTILDTLRNGYAKENVNEIVDANVDSLEFLDNKIRVVGNSFNKVYDVVVLTTGSKAGLNNAPAKYNTNLIESTGHTLTKMYPALSPMYVFDSIASLRGIRAKVKAKMFIKDTYEVEGEVLFKDDALSGICMFELSSFYARNMIKGNVNNLNIHLDFLNEYSLEEIVLKLKSMKENLKDEDANTLLNGFFPKMLAKYILDASKINTKDRLIKDLSDEELIVIASNIKDQVFKVNTNKVSSSCQIMVGGVSLKDVDPNTLESKLHHNLYFGGEVLNIDGQCGGYNLHFAFASGNLIAESIYKRNGE